MNILVADDDLHVLRLVRRVLEREGFRVIPVAGGAELLEAWRTARPDAVLSDIEMPGGPDGIQACAAIRSADPGARLYLMTGDPSVRDRANLCGLPIALRKPFTIDELAAWANALRDP